MSVGTVTLLLLILIAVDPRVREQVSTRAISRPSAELAVAGQQARNFTTVIVQVARDQSSTHAPLLIFALAGTVLVLFMLRT